MTLVEVVVALTLLAVVGHAAWTTVHTADRVRLAAWARADLQSTTAAVERALRGALEPAGRGLLSSANLGAIHVRVAGGEHGASDTLTVLHAVGPLVANASRPCSAATGACILLLGDERSGFRTGDLVVTGSPATGARLFQLTGPPEAVRAPCGADCPERLRCSLRSDPHSAPGGSYAQVVGADAGAGLVDGAVCEQPFLPGGRACRERLDEAVFRRQWPACSVVGEERQFTRLRVADRTAAVGFPSGPAAWLRSAAATPLVRTQRVAAMRYWVRGGGQAGVLVEQNGLRANGGWNAAEPLAAPVASLRVETLHQGDRIWTRGVGVTEAELLPSAANRVRTLLPAPDAPPAWSHRRGYHTLAAVRVVAGLLHRGRDGQAAGVERHLIVPLAQQRVGQSGGP